MAKAGKSAKSVKKESRQAVVPVRTLAEDAAAERMAALFKALSDPTRLHIIGQLHRQAALARAQSNAVTEPIDKATDVRRAKDAGDITTDTLTDAEMTVGDICLYITGDQEFTSTVFHHLKELKFAGLITIRRDGKHKRCRLNPERLAEMAAYFGPVLTEIDGK